MAKLANISVGGRNPVRIMGILNTSPESFYKKSINTTRMKIRNTVIQMENEVQILLMWEECLLHHICQLMSLKK